MRPQPADSLSRLPWTPQFLQEIKSVGEETGLIVTTELLLRRDNIRVDVEGEFDKLADHQEGVLFVGDHKNRWSLWH